VLEILHQDKKRGREIDIQRGKVREREGEREKWYEREVKEER
jgi:hypothetical protein